MTAYPVRALVSMVLAFGAGASLISAPPVVLTARQQGTPQAEITFRITGEPGALPRYAVPDLIALSPDADSSAAAKLIAQVLFDDLAFEREFYLIPRDTYATVPRARSLTDVSFDRWRELGTDALVVGTVQKEGDQLRVAVRLFSVRDRQSAFGREYRGATSNPRFFAHTIADEIHQTQVNLRGVARTKLAFVSDRDGERIKQTFGDRAVKEIYISDYDGQNQRRLTTGRGLNITPAWSPDARSLAYTSYRRGYGDLFISNIYQGTVPENPTKGRGESFLPAWSPDGTRLAFCSDRDGNPEIYVMNRDGSGLLRLTHHPAIDVTPTWSPSGTQIAFTSDRSGSPQIYVMSADGVGGAKRITNEAYCDRPTWSPPPFNEIAFAARSSGSIDIKILDVATSVVRQLTFGNGLNESPTFAPNGRHLAFTSTRSGRAQIYVIDREGKHPTQLTRSGNNTMPDWSR
jgi:TolB protein